MIWFAAGAALSFTAFLWSGAGRDWKIWLGGFLPFGGLAIGFGVIDSFLIVLSLLIAGTALQAFLAWRGGLLWILAPVALSDMFLTLAFSSRYAGTFDWSLPSSGDWETGAILVAAAAIARGAAALIAVAPRHIALSSLFLWEGAALAWWVGASAAPLLIGSALLMSALAARTPERAPAILGISVTLAAASTGAGLVSITGAFAGGALMLGERVVSLWALGLLPLSALTRVEIGVNPATLALLVVLPAIWILALGAATKAHRGRSGLVLALGAATGSLLTATGSDIQWLVYGAGLAAILSWRLAQAASESSFEFGLQRVAAAPIGWLSPVTLSLLAVSFALVVRLFLIGQSTGFL